jgi:hypothetical protein
VDKSKEGEENAEEGGKEKNEHFANFYYEPEHT